MGGSLPQKGEAKKKKKKVAVLRILRPVMMGAAAWLRNRQLVAVGPGPVLKAHTNVGPRKRCHEAIHTLKPNAVPVRCRELIVS